LLDLPPVAFEPGVTVVHGKRKVRVRDYVPSTGSAGPLVVEVDDVPVGLVHFDRSGRLAAAGALDRVRARAPVPVVLASSRPAPDAAATAAALGVETHLGDLSHADTARLVENCRERGLRPAFVGDCRRHAQAAVNAHVAISLIDAPDLDTEPADFVLLEPRLDLFADVWDVSRSHVVRVRSTRDWVLIPNLVCVASAFLLGGTALTSVLISNLGTLGLYSRSVGALRSVEATGGRSRRVRIA
jgi:cation transport ATPase